MKPSMPGLEAPFMDLNRHLVSSSVVSMPSIEFARRRGILLFSSSSRGFVSPSEHRNFVSASGEVSSCGWSSYIDWKAA